MNWYNILLPPWCKPKSNFDFSSVALPLVRQSFSQIAASTLIGTQPMPNPSALVFYMDYQYGTNKVSASNVDQYYLMVGSEAYKRCEMKK